MKKLSISIVAVKKITSQVSRSNFADSDLEKAARLSLEAEGLINPIVIRRTSLESYEVVDGDFEYHAAARAREIDPRKGEMVAAFILEPENEEVLLEQVKTLRKGRTIKSTVEVTENQPVTSLEYRLTNIESRFEKQNNELKSELVQLIKKIEDEVKDIKNEIPQQLEPLEVFNDLKISELIYRLKSGGITGKVAEKIINIIERERKHKKFESLSDVVDRVQGLNAKRMLALIDSWSKILFK